MKRSASKASDVSAGSKPRLRFVDAAGEHTFGASQSAAGDEGTGDSESALRFKIAQRSSP